MNSPRPPQGTHEGAEGSLLRERNFLLLWATRLSGQTASQMMMVALGWQMYELTGQAWDLGLVGLAEFLPALLFTLAGGHVADRHNRARILLCTTGALLAVSGVLAAGTQGGWITRGLVLMLAVMIGTVRAFQMPAMQALITQVVPVALLPRAIAANASSMQFAILGGPAFGGLIYGVSAWGCYATCVLLLAIAFSVCVFIHVPRPAPPTEVTSWRSVLAGVRFIFDRPVLLGALSLDLFAVLFGGAVALLPIFAKDILHVGAWGLGLMRSAPAVGALTMSLALSRWPIRRRAGHVLFAGVAVFGLCMLGFAISRSLVLSLGLLAISGAADMVSVIIRNSWVQLDTPDAMRGRVSAVNSIFIGASNQLGEFESGATAAALGPIGSVVLGGVGTLLVAVLWRRWFPQLWHRDKLTAD